MNYVDLDIMTRGTGDTDLEPSEEFPILFGLLTAPMTSTNGVKSYYSKYSKSQDYQFEADSSALSDDGCAHDDDDCSSCVISEDDDDSQSSDEVVSSNLPQHLNFRHGLNQDPEDFPTSTTVDDEDYDDMVIPHSANICRITRPTRILKRSYHQMRNSSPNQDESRTDEESDDTDTEDEEVKGYCFTQGGLERLKMFQLKRLVSHASSSPQQRLTDDLESLQNTQQQPTTHDQRKPNRKKPCTSAAWLEMIGRQRTRNAINCQENATGSTNNHHESFIKTQQSIINSSNTLFVEKNPTKDENKCLSHTKPGESAGRTFSANTLEPNVTNTKSINNNRCSSEDFSCKNYAHHQHIANDSNEHGSSYKCPRCDLIFEERQPFSSHLNNCHGHQNTSKMEGGTDLN